MAIEQYQPVTAIKSMHDWPDGVIVRLYCGHERWLDRKTYDQCGGQAIVGNTVRLACHACPLKPNPYEGETSATPEESAPDDHDEVLRER